MFALDTNVASELMRPEPTPAVATRVAECNAREMYLPEVTEAELRYGVAITWVGRLRNTLESVMTRWLDLGLRERIRPFISASARAPAARPAVVHRALEPFNARKRRLSHADSHVVLVQRAGTVANDVLLTASGHLSTAFRPGDQPGRARPASGRVSWERPGTGRDYSFRGSRACWRE